MLKKGILVVDDEPDISFTIKIALELSGFKVDSFNHPIAALANFRAGLYDLAILDIIMPVMTGFVLYKKIRKLDEQVKICFLTATDIDHENLRKKGFTEIDLNNHIIKKPIDNDELMRQVRSFLD